MRQSTERRAPRPLRPAAAALSKMVSRSWSLPPQRNFVAVERNVQVPMSDGTVLLADHYLPIISQPAATVLVRCPYGRGLPFSLLEAQLAAERGFHVLLQSCRGTFGSGGQFEPMRHEISDGQDTVAWLRGQSWFDGRLAIRAQLPGLRAVGPGHGPAAGTGRRGGVRRPARLQPERVPQRRLRSVHLPQLE